MKKNKLNIICLLLLLITINMSCTDWLDVQPKSEVGMDEMFATEKGYFDALMGVYVKMGAASTYGDKLTMSVTELLAQNYKLVSNEDIKFSNYDYSSEYANSIFSDIWRTQYNTIANCNAIIDKIKVDSPNKFTNNNYDIVYGEVLAIRALLHFDLLRLYHPSYLSSKDYIAIPYITEFTKGTTRQFSTEDVVVNVLKDLNDAYELLKDVDPIINDVENLSFADRQIRLNYYAISALLARVNLYIGDKDNALRHANEVILAGSFNFIAATDIIPNHDYSFACEHIFSLYANNIGIFSRNHFYDSAPSELITSSNVNDLYDDSDLRFKYWFKSVIAEEGEEKRFVKKFNRPRDEEAEKAYYDPVMPIVKISEMYLIAAECMAKTELSTAVSLLETLHLKRESANLGEIVDEETLMIEIQKEYQREFVGEGQLFYFYKRLGILEITGDAGAKFYMDDKKYTFPLPEDEIQFGGRNLN